MHARAGKKKSKLESWVRASVTPLFLVSGRRRVLFFNAGCEQLTGWSADEIIGKLCEFHSEEDAGSLSSLTTALCPPPATFSGEEQAVPAFLPVKQGAAVPRLIRFVPIHETPDQVGSVLGLISPLPAPAGTQPSPLALRYHAELSALRWALRRRFGLRTVIARSAAMRRVCEQLRLAKLSPIPVHFAGLRGVGKEHLARAIHQEDEAQCGSFLPLDCRDSPLTLTQTIQRLLHPDATDAKIGALQPRTIFLNEVTALPRDLQQRLLDEFQVGGNSPSRSTLLPRVISSSSESLPEARLDERLLPDFFYWLTALTIEIPPLRERKEDLEPLAQSFLEASNRNSERQMTGFTADVWPQLREYHWPGNLDELASVVQSARDNAAETFVTLKDLPLRFRAGLDAQAIGPPTQSLAEEPLPKKLDAHLENIERELITRALAKAKQNKAQAARMLGLPRPVLYRRMHALGMMNRDSTESTA